MTITTTLKSLMKREEEAVDNYKDVLYDVKQAKFWLEWDINYYNNIYAQREITESCTEEWHRKVRDSNIKESHNGYNLKMAKLQPQVEKAEQELKSVRAEMKAYFKKLMAD